MKKNKENNLDDPMLLHAAAKGLMLPKSMQLNFDKTQSDCDSCIHYDGFGQCIEHGNNLIENCTDYKRSEL